MGLSFLKLPGPGRGSTGTQWRTRVSSFQATSKSKGGVAPSPGTCRAAGSTGEHARHPPLAPHVSWPEPLPLPWAPSSRVSSTAMEAPRSRLAVVHSSLAALTWDPELPCSGKQGATLLSAQSPGMTQELVQEPPGELAVHRPKASPGVGELILRALCCWLSWGSSREDGGQGQRKQHSLPLPLTTVIPRYPQAASEGPGWVLGAPTGNQKPLAAQGA